MLRFSLRNSTSEGAVSSLPSGRDVPWWEGRRVHLAPATADGGWLVWYRKGWFRRAQPMFRVGTEAGSDGRIPCLAGVERTGAEHAEGFSQFVTEYPALFEDPFGAWAVGFAVEKFLVGSAVNPVFTSPVVDGWFLVSMHASSAGVFVVAARGPETGREPEVRLVGVWASMRPMMTDLRDVEEVAAWLLSDPADFGFFRGCKEKVENICGAGEIVDEFKKVEIAAQLTA